MEKTLQNRLLYFFVALFIITNLGFYKTYLIHFPKFEGFHWIYHIHGMLAMAWILMLIAQAYLIRAQKYSLHKAIGKLSYIVFPLFLASLFFAAKEAYFQNIKKMSQADALAQMPLGGTIDIFFLGLVFAFAMIYKKNVGFHMRFMASTGFAILGPGLGRFLWPRWWYYNADMYHYCTYCLANNGHEKQKTSLSDGLLCVRCLMYECHWYW